MIIFTLSGPLNSNSIKDSAFFNPLSANPTKWSNTLKQFVSKLPTNCLSVFDHFVILAFKGLNWNNLLKVETDFENIGIKISQKNTFLFRR